MNDIVDAFLDDILKEVRAEEDVKIHLIKEKIQGDVDNDILEDLKESEEEILWKKEA